MSLPSIPGFQQIILSDSHTGQTVCYVARDVYKVPRQHNTCVMLPDVPFHNIKTPDFTLRSVPGNITHCLPGMTV